MVFHHLVTIWLIWFSYVVGYWKIGLLVLVVHDIADIPLEAAKAFSNMGMQK
jgi:ceramide synthetase